METYGDNTYTYTPNGSLLSKSNSEGTTKYSYDAMGNLLRVKLPDNRIITYQIDARGRRIGKKINGVFQYGFIYGDQLNPVAKVDENGSIVEQYVYGMKSNIPEYVIKGNKNYKIVSNHLGSPVMVVDMSDYSVVKEIKYDSFGNILLDSMPSFELPFRFAGGIWDKDTNLLRFGVRDYDSETGRWTSKEPLGFNGARKFGIQMSVKGYTTNQQSCNFYVYAGNDGVSYVDLNGLFKVSVIRYISFDKMTYYDKLARYMLQRLICKSIKNNKEYGGSFSETPYSIKYTAGTPIGNSSIKYPDVEAIFSIHTHGCWKFENAATGVDWNEMFSDKVKKGEGEGKGDVTLIREGVPNYLGTPSGRMLYMEYKNGKFEGKVFPDLDLSKCTCPNDFPYNKAWFPNKCGSLE